MARLVEEEEPNAASSENRQKGTTAEAKKVRDMVTDIIEYIEWRGETALRDISEKLKR